MATNKKVIEVEGGNAPSQTTGKVWTPTAEAKGRAGQNRLMAVVLWVLAIVAEIIGIWFLLKYTPLMGGKKIGMIAILAVDLILLIAGSSFWKKANRLDPPSRASALFGIQSQLGVIMAVVCFAPVIIVAFLKKEYLITGIAAAMMVGGGAASADYHPASQEQYAQQTAEVTALAGNDLVYWTKSGTKYHLYDDCHYINTSKTTEINHGTVAQARELKNITELCSACRTRMMNEKRISEDQLQQAQTALQSAQKAAGATQTETPQPTQ